MPEHHLPSELLLSYAAGALDEPTSLLVATHLALCPVCRRAVGGLEAVGGELLERIEPVPVSEAAFERLMGRLEEPAPPSPPRGAPPGGSLLPEPLRSYLGGRPERLPWRRLARGVEECRLGFADRRGRGMLIRAKGGQAIPWHTHEGQELTLVLAGGFADQGLSFARGDVAVADPDVTHRPVADPGEDCLCLVAAEGKPLLTGFWGRLLNPLIR